MALPAARLFSVISSCAATSTSRTKRQIGIAKQRFAAMSIERDNEEKRQEWVLRGSRQFNAPVSIVVPCDRLIHGGNIATFDCGGAVNCFVNAACSHGLGCVVIGQAIMWSPVMHASACITGDQVIPTCVVMGGSDDSFHANTVVSQRKSVDEATAFPGV